MNKVTWIKVLGVCLAIAMLFCIAAITNLNKEINAQKTQLEEQNATIINLRHSLETDKMTMDIMKTALDKRDSQISELKEAGYKECTNKNKIIDLYNGLAEFYKKYYDSDSLLGGLSIHSCSSFL